MRIWHSIDEVPADLEPTVVTIGNFDGVHLGHQHVISRAGEVSRDAGVVTVVAVTFDPHPMAVLRPEHAPMSLTDLDTRARLLEEAGVDDLLVLPFSREIAAWTPEEFIDKVLVTALHARAVVVGANFRFGNRASGDVSTLHEASGNGGFDVEGVALDGGPQVWSSTYIRTCLAAGDVEGAEEALGRPFAVSGVVQRGDQRGRALGFPTANVPVSPDAAVPADGVYAGWLRPLDDPGSGRLPAAISVGTNPTFAGERERRVEAYVLDRDNLELYDRPVEIGFVARLRGILAFDGIDPLIEAMTEDVDRARAILL